ncbi:MAG: hypothetical protein ACREAM_25255 [Blastocatellia bacterium]
MNVSKRELNKWRREAARLRKKLNRLNADLDAIERSETGPEAVESIAKQRTEVTNLLDRLARMEEKIDLYEPLAPDWSMNDILLLTAATLGILLFFLILSNYLSPNLFSR